jgi:flagellar L-ring protein precursor FlgH
MGKVKIMKRMMGVLSFGWILVTVVLPQNSWSVTPLVDLESGRSLVSNIKAHRVGDVVTIIIVESATANATSETENKERSEVGGGPGLGFLDFISEWNLDTESRYKGEGETVREGNLRAEISARIVEVLHNGDYRLSGTRMVDINGERQIIEITGICRPRDIGPDNSILSTYVSDARIAYTGSGHVTDTGSPGIITRIVNWLF